MDLKKLRYSKCPHCGMHGIDAFLKTTKNGTNELQCRCCGKHFKVDIGISIISKIAIILVMAIPISIFKSVLEWIWYVMGILLFLLVEYFLPIEPIDE